MKRRTLTARLVHAGLGGLLGPARSGARAEAACAALPAPVVDLDATGPYDPGDPQHARVDPAAQAALRAAVAPGRRFLTDVARLADRFRADPADTAAAGCALNALQGWAAAGALQGRMGGARHGQQAHYERKWLLVGLALAYRSLRRAATPAQARAIEAWLDALADAVWAFWEVDGRPTAHRRNNHFAWAGLAQAATATGTGSGLAWARARAACLTCLAQVQADGQLPMEWARGPLALHYHAFAAAPLVVSTELAEERGEHWAPDGDAQALQRLVDFTLAGLADPDALAARVGAPQRLPSPPDRAWLVLWARRDRAPARLQRWLPADAFVATLGGDLRRWAAR